MNAMKEALLDRMINIYGFEHPCVLEFCKLCENPDYNEVLLEIVVECHEANPCLENDL